MALSNLQFDSVEAVILPSVRDLGDGFTVRRVLPSRHRRMVGPFIFFDQMGPVSFGANDGLNVRPHPHIGLSTLTYLLEGEIVHRDSLGTVQTIRPGEVNWMTAGSGIVHSERTGTASRASARRLSGLQVWVALPKDSEEVAPSFAHHQATDMPTCESGGVMLTSIAGTIEGMTSPVSTFSDMIYAEIRFAGDARYAVKAHHIERALYVFAGAIRVAGQDGVFEAGQLVVLKPGADVIVQATGGAARLMLIGGEPLPEKRFIDWNFVSSSKERIEQAKDDWRADQFARVPGETEFIALPESSAAGREQIM